MSASPPRVIVVGGGFGGLSAACHLAAGGADVTLLEARDVVGGKAGSRAHAGFRWDTGPTLLTMPDVIDAVFALAHRALRDEVALVPLAPLCRYRFPSGAVLDHHADAARTAAEIARFSPRDAAQWPRFVRHAEKLDGLLGTTYTTAPFTGSVDFGARLARRGLAALALGGALGTLEGTAARWFESPEMRALVGRFATYVGASPAEASGAFAMIAHVEGRGDAVYPRGGMAAVARAMGGVADALGVTVRVNTPVAAVTRGARGWSVRTAAGAVHAAEAVVLNVDPLFAAARLLDAGAPWTRVLLRGQRDARSLSGVAVLLGLRGRTDGLALHNIFFPADYAREFDDVMGARRMPADPTVYIAACSHADPAAAPADHEALFALVNAPARLDLDWPQEEARVTERVLAALERVDPGARGRVVHTTALGPREFAATGSLDGALYGAAPHGAFGPFRRPLQRVPEVDGLYLAGGATHPGGGVPMVTLSGKHAASMCLADLGVARRAGAA